MSRFLFFFLLCSLGGCAATSDPAVVGQVAEIAAAGDTMLGVLGAPPIIGDLSSAVLAAMASIYGWKRLRGSEKGKLL